MICEEELTSKQLRITGTMVSYYFVCRRKLWLFSKGLNLENVSGNVDVIKGRVLHEERFQRETKREIALNTVKIDFLRFGDGVFVHEIKKSKKFEEAHIWQLKYYIWHLRRKGVNCSSGVIHYPASMRKVDVEWENADDLKLEQVLKEINAIITENTPPQVHERRMCSRCAYFDFCYA